MRALEALRPRPRPSFVGQALSAIVVLGLLVVACVPAAPQPAGSRMPPQPDARAVFGQFPGGGVGAPIVRSLLGPVPFPIEANVGQAPPDTDFLLRAGPMRVGFASGGPRIRLTDTAPGADPACASSVCARADYQSASGQSCPMAAHVLSLELVGAAHVAPAWTRAAETMVSRVRGQPDEWQTGIPAFEQVGYQDAWAGWPAADDVHGSSDGRRRGDCPICGDG